MMIGPRTGPRAATLLLLAALPLAPACKGGDGSSAADASPGSDASTDWLSLALVGEGPIQEIGVAELGGQVFVVGGFNDARAMLRTVQVYDPATDAWSLAAPLPRAVHHPNVAVSGGKLYVVGAMVLDGFNFVAIPDVWEYDPDLDEWIDKEPMPAGTERGSAATAAVGGKIYVAGGLRSGPVADVSAFDPAANEWDTTLPPLPSGRDHLVGAAVGGVFYAIGGRTGFPRPLLGDVLAFDPDQGGWEQRAPMPTPRAGAGAGVVDDLIVVAGGEGNAQVSSGVFAEVEAFDPAANEWQSLSPMRTPRHGMGAAGHDGVLYVPGGATRQGFGAVAHHEAIRIR